MAGRIVQLRVGGQTYRVTTSASEQDLQRLAAVVDEKLATVVPAGRAVTPQAMLLAAIALANDLEEEKARSAALTEKARGAFGKILKRVDTALETAAPVAAAPGGSVAPAAPLGNSVAPAASSVPALRGVSSEPGASRPAALGALQNLGPLGLPGAANLPSDDR